MAIEETIAIEVSGVGELTAAAEAADKAADAFARLQEMAGKGLDMGAAGAGAGKLADSYNAAFAKIQAGFDKLGESMGKLGDTGSGAAGAGAAKFAETWNAALADVNAGIDKTAQAAGKLGDIGAGAGTSAAEIGKLDDSLDAAAGSAAKLGAALPAVGDGLKGVGDTTKQNSAWLDEYNATMAESVKMQRDLAGASADSSLVIARSQKLQADAGSALTTQTVEQDAAIARTAKASKIAQADAAAQAEATAKSHEMLALGVGAAAAYGIDKASQLQTAVTRLYTSAGESQKNLPMIEQGILNLAPQTATSQSQLAQGAYYVESAGFHGQSALQVLKAVSEGAYAEGAPLGDVANAETSILNAYGIKPSQSMSVMNQMLTAVGQGKMTMGGLSSALPQVLPVASSAGISLPQILGSMSSMTAMGTSPDQAAQNLRHAITAIQKPSSVQSAEMQMLGINPNQLSKDLGKEGLTGTIGEVDNAIKTHMTSGGMVMLDTLNQSKLAAQSATEEISAMPPAIQKTAKAYLDGSITAAQWNQEMFKGSESAGEKNLLQQFASTANLAHGFSSIVKSGLGDKQTVAAALNALMGGQVGQQVALELGGLHLPTTTSDVGKVGQAGQQNGPNVQGWGDVEKTLKFQLGSAEQGLESALTQMGKVFLPAATGGLKDIASVAKFFAGNAGLTKDLAELGGGLGALLGVKYVGGKAAGAAQDIGKMLGLGNIGKSAGLDSAASGLTGAASSLDGAAASLEGAAAALKGETLPGTPGGKPGGLPPETGPESTVVSDAEKAAPAGLTFTSALAGLQKVALPAAVMTWVDQMAKDWGAKAAPKIHAPQAKPDSTGSSVAYQVGQNAMTQLPVLGPTISLIEGLFGVKPGKPLATPGSGPVGAQPSYAPPEVTEPGNGRFGPVGQLYTPAARNVPASTFATPPAPTADQLGIGGHPSPIKISVDTSALDAAKGKVQSDIAGLGGHPTPIRLPAPDTSAIDNAKSKVQSDIAGLGGHPSPVRLPAPDLSALVAAKGAAAADGSAVGAGFAAGIASETGAAAAAGASLAAAAEAAMKVHMQISSPSKVTEKIGIDSATGFANGLTEGASAVKAASAEIGSNSVASLIQGLMGGQSDIQDATQAILGASANADAVTSIQQSILQLQQSVPAGDSSLVKWLTTQGNKLASLANKQGALMTEISDAQQTATSVIGAEGITSAYGYTPALAASNGPTASQSLITGMQQQLADTKSFAGELTKLQKGGLNATTESQLAQAGVSAGLPLAEGLQQGGKGAIQQMNSIGAQLIKASQQIGNVAGPAMYTSGQQAGQGLATGLKDELKDVDKDMTKIADTIITDVQKKLGTKASSTSSSSTAAGTTTSAAASAGTVSVPSLGALGTSAAAAASGLGKVGPAGGTAAAGLDAVGPAAAAAAAGLGKISSVLAPLLAAVQPSSGKAQPLGGGGYTASTGGGGGSGGQVQPIHIHLNVDGQQMATVVQNVQIQQAASNWQSSPVPMPAGRRT